MKAWVITVGEPLPLPGATARLWRSGLLVNELRSRGHDVLWWTSSVDHFTKQYFVEGSVRRPVAQDLELQFLHGRPYVRNISLARLLNHQDIAREFRRLAAAEPAPDVILCSYPTIELSDEAVQYGKANGVPVFLDIRDLWPDEMAARLPRLLQPLAPMLLPRMYSRSRRALREATGIIAISKTYLEWARRHGERRSSANDLWAPLGYRTRNPDPAANTAAQRKYLEMGVRPDRRMVWFCGTFVGSIDLATAIRAASLLSGNDEFQFVFTGSGEREAEWKALARELPNVVFTGWATEDEIGWLSHNAWVGLGAYKPDALMSLPNKLFEYMSAALPIVSSLRGEAEELIQACDAGVTYDAGNEHHLADCLRELASDPERTARFAQNAFRAYRQHFSAELVYRRMAEFLESHAQASSHADTQPFLASRAG